MVYTNYTVKVSSQNMYTPPNLADNLYGQPKTFLTAEGGKIYKTYFINYLNLPTYYVYIIICV